MRPPATPRGRVAVSLAALATLIATTAGVTLLVRDDPTPAALITDNETTTTSQADQATTTTHLAPTPDTTTPTKIDATPPVTHQPLIPTTPRTTPPPAPVSHTSGAAEGEALAPGSVLHEAGASNGAFARASNVEGDLHVPTGTYVLTARVRAATPTRVDLSTAGELVGSWEVSSAWQDVEGATWLTGGEAVGIRAGAPVDVDRITLTPISSQLTTRGTRLISPSGATFKPRGVNYPGYNAPANVDGRLRLPIAPIDDFYRWGATIVRLPLNQEHWLADCPVTYGDSGSNYRAVIIKTVNDMTARGIAVMATLTVTERGRATGCAEASADPLLKEMADARSVSYWRSVAETFRGNPMVIFDLFNEPNNISDGVWRNGGQVDTEKASDRFQATGMQALYEAVRSASARNVVSVSGVHFAGKPTLLISHPLDAASIVAGMHIYCLECSAPRLPDKIDENSAEVRVRFPLLVTEGGWNKSDDPRYNRQLVDWAERNSAGWALYAFFTPDNAFSLVREWRTGTFHVGQGQNTLAPSRRGAPVWNTLAGNRTARGYNASHVPE